MQLGDRRFTLHAMAKEFSGDKSARFVNGILGAYVRSQA